MHSSGPPALSFDEVDDLLYFTRANEVSDLQQTITELSQKYSCSAKDVLEAAIDPESGNTVLHFCSANGLAELLPSLLSHLGAAEGTPAAFVNHGNKEGNTPLHWAAYNGHLAIVKLLIAAGADMWQKNAAGHLAMFEAERADKNDGSAPARGGWERGRKSWRGRSAVRGGCRGCARRRSKQQRSGYCRRRDHGERTLKRLPERRNAIWTSPVCKQMRRTECRTTRYERRRPRILTSLMRLS